MEQASEKMKVSVLIPTYNNSLTIAETIKSILNQSYTDFELVICDDKSTDSTVNLIRSIKDVRIKLYINEKNLGCGGNMNACANMASGDILVYVCGDDLFDADALKKIYEAFQIAEDIGVVARPYYWFEENFRKPVRMTMQFDKTEIVSMDSSFDKIRDVIALSGQLSGIGFRKKHMHALFDGQPFIETASMVMNILKKNPVVILKDNIIAVRINSSGSMNYSVYVKSPMLAWYSLIDRIFFEDRYEPLKKYLVNNFVANNYIGLVQIKNYGNYKFLIREIWYLLRMRWQNIYNPLFWFFSAGTIIVPKFILRRLVTIFKNKINSKSLNIKSINTT